MFDSAGVADRSPTRFLRKITRFAVSVSVRPGARCVSCGAFVKTSVKGGYPFRSRKTVCSHLQNDVFSTGEFRGSFSGNPGARTAPPVLERGLRFDSPPPRDWTRSTEPASKSLGVSKHFSRKHVVGVSEMCTLSRSRSKIKYRSRVPSKNHAFRCRKSRSKGVPLPGPEKRLFTSSK